MVLLVRGGVVCLMEFNKTGVVSRWCRGCWVGMIRRRGGKEGRGGALSSGAPVACGTLRHGE